MITVQCSSKRNLAKEYLEIRPQLVCVTCLEQNVAICQLMIQVFLLFVTGIWILKARQIARSNEKHMYIRRRGKSMEDRWIMDYMCYIHNSEKAPN